MWPIALSTFKEVYRKRIVHIVAVLTLIYWALLGFIISTQPKTVAEGTTLLASIMNLSSMLSILGFYLSNMLLAFLTVMLSVGIISSEVEDGTVLTLLTKPIPRYAYVLGKYIGVALMVTFYALLLYGAIMGLAAYGGQNFIKVFGLTALLKGFCLFVWQPLCIAAIAVLGSTFFKTVNNGIFVISLYLLGSIGGIMEQIGAMTNQPDLSTYGIIAGLIAPFEVIYRKLINTVFSSIGGLQMVLGMGMGTSGTSTAPSAAMMLYTLIYTGCALWLAVRRMNRKDIS